MLTACGIETTLWYLLPLCGRRRLVATVLTACGIETPPKSSRNIGRTPLVATVLTACGIETLLLFRESLHEFCLIVTVLTACGMRRRVRGSRGAKRRWGPHISSPWPKGRENKGDEVTVLTACGIETLADLYREQMNFPYVATVLTACGMRRRVRGSRGAKRRWGPHISSPWPKGRENKGDKATVLISYRLRYWNLKSCWYICPDGVIYCNCSYCLRYWNSWIFLDILYVYS